MQHALSGMFTDRLLVRMQLSVLYHDVISASLVLVSLGCTGAANQISLTNSIWPIINERSIDICVTNRLNVGVNNMAYLHFYVSSYVLIYDINLIKNILQIASVTCIYIHIQCIFTTVYLNCLSHCRRK